MKNQPKCQIPLLWLEQGYFDKNNLPETFPVFLNLNGGKILMALLKLIINKIF
jgi:hypothetical protein